MIASIRPFPGSSYRDVILVHAAPTGQDDEGGPLDTPGPPGSPIACSVQENQTTSIGTHETDVATPFGMATKTIRSRNNLEVVTYQQIDWITCQGQDFPAPRILSANGLSRRLGRDEWATDCTLRE